MIFAKLRYLSRLLKSFAHKTMTKNGLPTYENRMKNTRSAPLTMERSCMFKSQAYAREY